MKTKILVLAMVLCTAFGVVPAQAKTYKIDPAHTRILFFVDHLGFAKLPGQFNNVHGIIEYNLESNESSMVDIAVDATQLSMGNAALDTKLQGKDYFNVARFPVIQFKSTSIRRLSIAHGKVTGNLTLLGVTRPVTLDVVFNGRKWNRRAKAEYAGFSATGKIRRSEFGMKTLLPDVGDVVELRIEVEAREVRPAILQQAVQ